MTVLKQDYPQFSSEHNAINTCIGNIENELNVTNTNIETMNANNSGNWIDVDVNDWQNIKNDINSKFEKLQELMAAAGGAVENTSNVVENTYAGLDSTIV